MEISDNDKEKNTDKENPATDSDHQTTSDPSTANDRPTAGDRPINTSTPLRRRGSRGKIWVPIGFVLVGVVLLFRQMGIAIVPEWLFSWPTLLIAIGIISGLAHAFRGPGWLIMILIGTFFLLDQLIPGMDIHRFIWPGIIIIVGLVMLIRPKKPHWMDHNWEEGWKRKDYQRWQRRCARRGYPGDYSDRFNNSARWQGTGTTENAGASGNMGGEGNVGGTSNTGFRGMGTGPMGGGYTGGMGSTTKGFSSEDFIDATTVFGGIHKNILSKNFKGGDLTIFMGGAEINLSQADIQGTASLDITQIMGGTKIIVPADWEVRSQLTSVFGNIEDKRQNIGITDPNKVLIIDGSSVFGGIEIRNY